MLILLARGGRKYAAPVGLWLLLSPLNCQKRPPTLPGERDVAFSPCS